MRTGSNLMTGTGDSPPENEVQGRQDSLKSICEEGVGLRNKQGSNEMAFASVGKREGTTCYGEGVNVPGASTGFDCEPTFARPSPMSAQLNYLCIELLQLRTMAERMIKWKPRRRWQRTMAMDDGDGR